MNAFLAQLPALLGVLVGTLGTILATSLADRGRWRRGQRVRWDERRLEAYVELSRAVKEIHAVSMRMLVAARPDRSGHAIEREEGLARLAEADVRNTLAWENVLLLGDAATVEAGRGWREAVWRIERMAHDPNGQDDHGTRLVDLKGRADRARDAFYQAARTGLGVPGGSVAQSDWLAARHEHRVGAGLASSWHS
ncbi:hypothetical protein [Micromonospora yangpuensis]|uniref:Secreted protein n=1 Tax=Micromonospora yangpuensis TaxID=683228 RepID=A0A1C6URQ6_9ACTN|nr:hypothetical protein [Micromonospora yangpuensis]GGM06691.1 hypothetical protein GCM10012279_25750 [Micromonospora yangpuensis]SCL56755.1 hypothetical protein GA0070617_3329 [Micromonospora yangpuensis]